MLQLINLVPVQFRAGLAVSAVLLAVAGMGGAGLYLDHEGYHRAELEWTVKYNQREAELNKQRFDELNRQAAVNDEAKQEEEAALEAYRQQMIQMGELNEQLAEEAAADPGHDNIALDADAVARHNRRTP